MKREFKVIAAMAFYSALAVGKEPPSFSDICSLLTKKIDQALRSPESKATREAMIDLGLKLHGDLVTSMPNDKVVTSPFSILSMLGMLRNAADGKTAQEMHATLLGAQANLSLEQFNRGMTELSSSLRTVQDDVLLTFGNIAVLDKPFTVHPQFKADLQKYFGAAAENWDFSDTNKLIADLNGYISKQTNGMIPNLLKEDDAPHVWALINAGYYKSSWAIKFDVLKTDENFTFKLGDGTEKKIPMMLMSGAKLPYFRGEGFQVVSIPYQDATFTMDLILPTLKENETQAQALTRVSQLFSGRNYSEWIRNLTPTELEMLGLPRWETGSELREELLQLLQARMPSLFSPTADLSNMLAEGKAPALGKIVHATLVKTNEEGSEGSFVTYGGGLESVRITPTVLADHPFIAVIRHVPTGIPVFVITERDPKPLARPGQEKSVTVAPQTTDPLSQLLAARNTQLLEKAVDAFDRSVQTMYTVDGYLKMVFASHVSRASIVKDMKGPKKEQLEEILVFVRENGLAKEFLAPMEQNADRFASGVIEGIRAYLNSQI